MTFSRGWTTAHHSTPCPFALACAVILEAIAAAAARAAAAAAGFIPPDACRAGEGEAASNEKPELVAWPLIAKALALAIRAAASASTRGSIVGGGATAAWGTRPAGVVVTLAGGGTALYFGPPPPPPPEGVGRERPTPGARQCAPASYAAACV